ncbi:hypothetical protein BSKO_08898 [Bryopsis sp. KO-2023]|nr:hypothetical protein BSKO_08898 [Bryopsis sp. KO-2023]
MALQWCDRFARGRSLQICKQLHRLSFSAQAQPAVVVERDLLKNLNMTQREVGKACDKLRPVFTNVRRLLEEPMQHENFSGNLKLLRDLGMQAQGLKQAITGAQVLIRMDPDITQEKIHWLKSELALTDQEICKIIADHPRLLEYHLEGQVPDAEKSGLSKKELKSMVVDCPQLLKRPMDKKIPGIIFLLAKNGIHRDKAIDILKAQPALLSYPTTTVKGIIKWVVEADIPVSELFTMLRKNSNFFSLGGMDKVDAKVKWFVECVGIDKETVIRKLVMKAPIVFAKVTQNILAERYRLLRDVGFSKEECRRIVLRYPTIFTRAPSGILSKVTFATDVLKKSLASIASYPGYFGISMHNRVLFRVAFLEAKEEDSTGRSLRSYVSAKDEEFFKGYSEGELATFREWWDTLDMEMKHVSVREKKFMVDFSKHRKQPGPEDSLY